MRQFKCTAAAAVIALAVGSSGSAFANTQLLKMQENPNDWVMQNGNYANTRYSELDQINAGNVKDLRVSWTFSTGVLRGHEGGPLVVGDTMYVHTPFPNNTPVEKLAPYKKLPCRFSTNCRMSGSWRSQPVVPLTIGVSVSRAILTCCSIAAG